MEIPPDYRTRRAGAFVAEVLERLSQANSEIARNYFQMQTGKGNKLSSLVNTGSYLLHLDTLNNGKSFRTLKPDDLTNTIVTYAKTHRPASVHRFTVYLKALYAWLHKGTLPRSYKAVLQMKRPKIVKKRPLSEDDFRALLHQAWGRNQSNRGWMRQALLWVLWDSGFRISEALALRVGSVTILDDGAAQLEIPKDAPHLKTGPRTIDVAECVPALAIWLKHHPERANPNAFLFPSDRQKGASLEPTTVNRLLGMWSRNANFSRVVTCHVFRHTRATRAAKAGWSSWQMEPYFGWIPGSKESATYVHMVAADVAHKVREAANVDPLGALVRKDPKKALEEAVTAASNAGAKSMARELLTELGLMDLLRARRGDRDDNSASAAPTPKA